MNIPPPPRRPFNTPAPAAPVILDLTPRKAETPCPRILFYGVEGFGKTTLAANAPKPVIFAARDEQGVKPLVDSGLITGVPVLDCSTFAETLGMIDSLIADTQGIQTAAFDSLGAFERLAMEAVCTRDFKGEWGENGFASYGKGVAGTLTEMLKLLQRLDSLNKKGVTILVLAHATVKNFKNPTGADFDQYQVACLPQIWDTVSRWSDAILFAKFESIVEIGGKSKGNIAKDRGKGIGGTDRVVYTERRDAFVAKNRYGMPAEIELSGDRERSWSEIWQHIVK